VISSYPTRRCRHRLGALWPNPPAPVRRPSRRADTLRRTPSDATDAPREATRLDRPWHAAGGGGCRRAFERGDTGGTRASPTTWRVRSRVASRAAPYAVPRRGPKPPRATGGDRWRNAGTTSSQPVRHVGGDPARMASRTAAAPHPSPPTMASRRS
jgi:hypothetical protein